jgi:hypothetical protein
MDIKILKSNAKSTLPGKVKIRFGINLDATITFTDVSRL